MSIEEITIGYWLKILSIDRSACTPNQESAFLAESIKALQNHGFDLDTQLRDMTSDRIAKMRLIVLLGAGMIGIQYSDYYLLYLNAVGLIELQRQ